MTAFLFPLTGVHALWHVESRRRAAWQKGLYSKEFSPTAPCRAFSISSLAFKREALISMPTRRSAPLNLVATLRTCRHIDVHSGNEAGALKTPAIKRALPPNGARTRNQFRRQPETLWQLSPKDLAPVSGRIHKSTTARSTDFSAPTAFRERG